MIILLLLSFFFTITAVFGIFLSRKNIILIIMSIELMLLAVNYNYIIFSLYNDDLFGQLSSLLILAVGACETSIGLALMISYYKTYKYI
jgi:NADH-quinone oxidoreductase subunit K